jgi:hypothetical protein
LAAGLALRESGRSSLSEHSSSRGRLAPGRAVHFRGLARGAEEEETKGYRLARGLVGSEYGESPTPHLIFRGCLGAGAGRAYQQHTAPAAAPTAARDRGPGAGNVTCCVPCMPRRYFRPHIAVTVQSRIRV